MTIKWTLSLKHGSAWLVQTEEGAIVAGGLTKEAALKQATEKAAQQGIDVQITDTTVDDTRIAGA